jgi:imidazole glycerol phosphate synthase subunit HisF
MAEFLFMLTKDDATVANCLDVYDGVRDTGLRWVGFKDIGVSTDTLRELVRRMKADGRHTVLEIVSVDAEAEVASIKAGIELGVELLMGGTRADLALPLLAGTGIKYMPFPGTIVGHPSVLEGTLDSISDSARDLTAMPGVYGLDLLAYRWKTGDVPELVRRVVKASAGPIVVAGSIVNAEQIDIVTKAGAWGFTIGGAVFDGVLVPGGSLLDQVNWALDTAAKAAAA